MWFSISLLWIVACGLFVFLLSSKCHKSSLTRSQHWIWQCLGTVREQAFNWNNANIGLCRAMASVGRDYLSKNILMPIWLGTLLFVTIPLQWPNSHPFINPASFLDDDVTDAGNACRNPDGRDGPWCFLADDGYFIFSTWGYCHTPFCGITRMFSLVIYTHTMTR